MSDANDPKYVNLQSGTTLEISELINKQVKLRAHIANTSIVNRVKFTLTNNAGKIVTTSTQRQFPFTMVSKFSDFGGIKAVPGTYILTADVYTPKSGAPVYSSKFKFKIK
ncbi:MAG: hypothetical protein NE330_12525 [Lentisphaeraceae bacterium]|nr:hypothetical protein [Lentisphaeraceae bacterium]